MLRSSDSAPDFYPTFAVLALNSDHRSKKVCLLCSIASFALAAALVLACAPASGPVDDDASLYLTDVIDFQAHNLTTDLIAIPEGIGMAAVDHGWQRRDAGDSGNAWLAVTGKLGRLSIFSADGDLEELELELSLGNAGVQDRSPVHVLLNGHRLDRLHPTPEWSSFSVLVPAEIVRRGVNVLELAPRSGNRSDTRQGGPQILLRRIRLRSRSDRPTWPARPHSIQNDGGVEMPVASYIDRLLRLPQEGRLKGGYEAEIVEPRSASVWAYIQLMDESGKEHTLLNRHLLKTVRRQRRVDLDLSPWAGELVRLRVGTTGPGNGVVRWRDLRVTARQPIEVPAPLPPIDREDVSKSRRLGQPDVFVILLDAARADAFSTFGGLHPTPATDRLASDGTAFEQALAPSSWTGQSVPSMLTGLYPDSLRIGPLGSVLPDEVPTLPELMNANGYRAVLWSQHPLYRNHKSFQRGFEEVHQTPPGAYSELPGGQELLDDNRPTFAWIHLIPPHTPYQPPEPFSGLYSSGYQGPMSVEAQYLSRFPHLEDPETLSEADLQYLKNRYLENVAFADSLVARLLAELERRGRYRSSLIVLLSDHGEAFLEHGAFLHTRSLHTELLHVPLVVKWPAEEEGFAGRVSSPVSLVDLVPTLVDGLGLTGADEGFQGTSLMRGVFDGVAEERPLYAVTRGVEDRSKAPKPAFMLQAGPWRLLHTPLTDTNELFHWENDAGEIEDLSSVEPLQTLLLEQGVRFQQHWNLRLLGDSLGEENVEELDPETVEQLQALGYLN